MKVICRNNKNCDLSPESRLFTADPAVTFNIEIGQEYNVYALTSDQHGVLYYICGINYSFYPHWYPASLFEIIDQRLSRYWQCSVLANSNRTTTELILAYPEWAADPNTYYWNLTEHEENAVQIWKKYKLLIEEEYKRKMTTASF